MLKYYLPVVKDEKYPYSFRVRAKIPSENNKNSKVINYLKDCNKDDVVVLAKKHTREDVDYLISKNINYIFDVSDDKWNPKWGPEDEWNYTCMHAKHITTTCQRLKEKVIEYTGRKEVTIIPDPTERPEEKAKFRVSGNMKLVYRGQLDDSRPGNNLSCDGNDLNHAIDCLMQNKVNDKLQKPSIGCNIKWIN